MFPRPPPNVTEAFTLDGSRYYVRGGNEVSEIRRITNRRLEVNLDDQIQQVQQEFVFVLFSFISHNQTITTHPRILAHILFQFWS
jgi:hypothetical protein